MYLVQGLQKLTCGQYIGIYQFGGWILGRVEKTKNGFGSYGYYFLNGFWYIENGGNFFFGIREYLDKWNFT